MQLSDATSHRVTHLEDAIRLLEANPDFPRAQLRMRERLEEAQRNAPDEARFDGTKARLEYVLQRFTIRAQAFLELVTDIHMQNAYMVVLEHFVSVAWEEYTGRPPELVRPTSDQAEEDFCSITTLMAEWVKVGYQRLASPYQEQTSSPGDMAPEPPAQAGTTDDNDSTARRRRAAIDAYIEEVHQKTGKKITRTAIWREAGYKTRTALERWERNDLKRRSVRADDKFTQILKSKPHLKKN